MRKKFRESSHRADFLASFENVITSSDIGSRCKFNFSYFDDTQPVGSAFGDLPHESLVEILNKFKNYTKEPLNFWRNRRSGGGGLKVFADYKEFPENSEFTQPKQVPRDVSWARFRLENMTRLIGFTIPGKVKEGSLDKNGVAFDKNTFYVVFLDLDHKFWVTEER